MSVEQPSMLHAQEALATISCEHVLIADDDAIFRRILQTWLESWGYRVLVAEDGAQAWSFLQHEHPPELLILDWVMPGIDGTELCRRIRERQRSPYQYILLATGKYEKQDVVRGLDAGADDYLTKPFEQNELRARLRVGRRILTLQQDLINARDELRFQATHDVLTGIWNREAVLDLLHRELDRSERSKTSTSVLMLDLDHFKKINDTLGHLTGDVVLREVANRIIRSVRSYDLVGRYGGEEFLIVLPGCGKVEVEESADRIRLAVASAPILAASSEVTVTASVGGTVAIPAGAISDKDLLLAADKALYEAKNGGRNRVAIA
jgi:two-component system cell cycle response regulator